MTNILPVIVSASMAIVKGVLNFVIAIIVSVYMISDHKIIFYHLNADVHDYAKADGWYNTQYSTWKR